MQTGLAGKVVIVTAATANIGRGIALAFAAEGARVVITGRDPRRRRTGGQARPRRRAPPTCSGARPT